MARPRLGAAQASARGRRLLLPAMLGLTVALVATCVPASASTTTVFGVAGNRATLSKAAGIALPENRYVPLTAGVPNTRMINLMPTTSWAAVAAAKPGSSLYTNLVRWGDTLRSRPGPVWLAFSHEPEAKGSRILGNAGQFIAAFRKVVTLIRSRGAKNVSFVWQMTAWAFQTSAADPRYASRWYPGDGYVNYVSADAYNWYRCGPGNGQWLQLAQVANPALHYAAAHHKGLLLGEFASQADPRRAQWLRNAAAWAAANAAVVRGMFYFQHADTASRGCNWMLTSTNDVIAFSQLAR